MEPFEITLRGVRKKYSELTAQEKELVDVARHATERSYAPYSNFHVGAAIRLANGDIISGSNQENAAFTSGTCAERSACFYAHSTFPDVPFDMIAVAAHDQNGEVKKPISPCGHCRQALLEFETIFKKDIPVILVGAQEVFIVPSIKSLLPLAFTNF